MPGERPAQRKDTSGPSVVRVVTHDEHRRRQEAVLARLLSVLQGDERVLAVLARGSYARGTHDAFSDLDVDCYLRDEARSGRPEIFERVAALASTLAVQYLYDVHALYLFTDGVRLDLDFKPPAAIARDWPADARILYDPDGVLAAESVREHTLAPPAHPQHFDPGDPAFVDWFFWMFRQAYCWARRGAQATDRPFHKLNAALTSVHSARTKLIEMRLWTLGTEPWYLERVDPACAARLAETYPRLQSDEIIAATRRLLAEFEVIAPDYCAKAGVPYPAGKADRLRRLLAELDALP